MQFAYQAGFLHEMFSLEADKMKNINGLSRRKNSL
jgi:hypothetical protein